VFAAIKAGQPTPELLAYQYLQTLPQMAQGDANKVWIVPSDFGKALEGFTKMLGAPGDDGVFRFEPSRDYVAASRPEEDDEAVAGWFDTSSDPHIAALVRAAEEVARKEVPGPGLPPLGPQVRPAFSGQPGAAQYVPPPQASPAEPPQSERTQRSSPPEGRETASERPPDTGPAEASRS
jgi:hypothetical protein